jgi:K+/H+ antiporter YhaU regulatory subunit KhtT
MVIKKIKGNKRHIAVDSNGILLSVLVHKANQHDSRQLINLIKKAAENKPNLIELIIGDSAYIGFDEDIRKEFNVGLHIQKSIKHLGKFIGDCIIRLF